LKDNLKVKRQSSKNTQFDFKTGKLYIFKKSQT